MHNKDALIRYLSENQINCKKINDSEFSRIYVIYNNQNICKIEYDLSVVSMKGLSDIQKKYVIKTRKLVKQFKSINI